MTVGVAPPVVLDGPLPRPPLYSLVSVAQEADEGAVGRGSAYLLPYPNALPLSEDPCVPSSPDGKDIPEATPYPDPFPAFTAYLGEVCSALGIGNWEEWKSRANVALTARESWALERQLVTAMYQSTTDAGGTPVPHLTDANVTFPGGTGGKPALTAVAWLEAAIAETGQEGVIHLPPPVASFLGDALRDDRGTLRTGAGTPVIVGQGYYFDDTDTSGDPSGGSSANAGQSWVYATGRVMYRRSSQLFNLPDTINEALDRDDNTVIYRAERDLWVGWDTQLQAAVLADWSP